MDVFVKLLKQKTVQWLPEETVLTYNHLSKCVKYAGKLRENQKTPLEDTRISVQSDKLARMFAISFDKLHSDIEFFLHR